jgi:UDP-glucose 4-epimerase
MRVLITGGAGFIGSHLCDALVTRGDKVTILDNLSTGTEKNITHLMHKVKVSPGDIRNQELVESLAEKSDLIVHLAAAVGVDNILTNPIESISINYLGSETVLKAALKFNKRIIIASTSEIYGKNSRQPLRENDDRVIGSPQKLRWSYSDSKALEESVAYFLYNEKKLNVTTIRLFNTVGPRQSGKYGMVIPRFVTAAVSNLPLKIFGDGSQTRVFCHVSDAVRAIVELSENENSIGEVFNVGGIQEISIKDLALKIIKITNSSSRLTFIPYENAYKLGFEDMPRRVPDLTKIARFIGWSPRIDLDDIIRDVASSTAKEI